MNNSELWQEVCTIHQGSTEGSVGNVIAAAIHDGHAIRDELLPLMAISATDRQREADSFTSYWTNIAPVRVVAKRSRFEVDLNRRRHRAIYLSEEDAWGLTVWEQTPDEQVVQRSLELYDAFYDRMRLLLDDIAARHGQFFVFDFHSYNHRRSGQRVACDDPEQNPQINICTGGMDLQRCEPVVARFERTLRNFDFPNGSLDVRRNIRFRATRFSRWVHENYPGVGISLALEVSKFYMDEWTDQPNAKLLHGLTEAFRSTVPHVRDAMQSLPG